jgi:hypothetical protein
MAITVSKVRTKKAHIKAIFPNEIKNKVRSAVVKNLTKKASTLSLYDLLGLLQNNSIESKTKNNV